MVEISGELWDYLGQAVIAVTTSGGVNARGECVMLRGCARQARDRFPGLAKELGKRIRVEGNHVHELGDGLVSFPVEEDPFGLPDLRIIERSCRELKGLADQGRWQRIIVPRPGCGGGGLQWTSVRPILSRYFDQRFYVINKD